MKTQNQRKIKKQRKQRKTRKMKGGYIHFVDGKWKTNPNKSNGQRRGDAAISYSNSEAIFFNKLGVPEYASSEDWISVPTNANDYLRRLAPDILGDVSGDVFTRGLLEMRTAIQALREAYEKRSASDKNIDDMTQEERDRLGITTADQERHKDYTFHMKKMLESIEEFMIPYEIKAKPEPTVKAVKTKPANLFSFFDRDALDETVPKGAEPEGAEARGAEPSGEAMEIVTSEGKPRKVKLKPNMNESSWIIDVRTIGFNFDEDIYSFCSKDGNIFIFSKGSLTIITAKGTTKYPISGLEECFCTSTKDVLFTYSGGCYKLNLNEEYELTSFENVLDDKYNIVGLSQDRGSVIGLNQTTVFKMNPVVTYNLKQTIGLKKPMGMCFMNHFLVVADSGSNAIFIINGTFDKDFTLTSFEKIGGNEGLKDGPDPRFKNPSDVYLIDDQTILVADTGNHRLCKLYKVEDKWISETIAGNGYAGNTDGIGMEAQFNEPFSFATHREEIFVLDKKNRKIRAIVFKGDKNAKPAKSEIPNTTEYTSDVKAEDSHDTRQAEVMKRLAEAKERKKQESDQWKTITLMSTIKVYSAKETKRRIKKLNKDIQEFIETISRECEGLTKVELLNKKQIKSIHLFFELIKEINTPENLDGNLFIVNATLQRLIAAYRS
jgi:hypothetical protein